MTSAVERPPRSTAEERHPGAERSGAQLKTFSVSDDARIDVDAQVNEQAPALKCV